MAKQFLVLWTLKHIKTFIIHKLGGYTYEDVLNATNNRVIDYSIYLKNHFISLEKELYGKSKQEWIDAIHKQIQNII